MSFAEQYLQETIQITEKLNIESIEELVDGIAEVKAMGGRLFFLGIGGSASNASHAVNDFRKIVGIESYAPTDNVSELTARTNDEGWETAFEKWLMTSRLKPEDALFILSVGGGKVAENVSSNLVYAMKYAAKIGAKIFGIVSRDGGYAAEVADTAILIPIINPDNTTPHAEAFQVVICHLIVSHPKLKEYPTKWESVVEKKAGALS